MATFTLWLFALALGVDLGAGLYEARIVVPLWSRGVPATLAEGDPFGRVAIDAGLRFWKYTTSAVAVCALAALVTGLRVAEPERTWRTSAAVLELGVVGWTLAYFRPTLVRLLMGHGSGLSTDDVKSIVGRWVLLGRARVALSFLAYAATLHALALR